MTPLYKSFAAIVIVFCVVLFFFRSGFSGQAVIDEQFDNLSNWQPLLFPKIETVSQYKIVSKEEGSVLEAQSSAAASALLYKREFNVFRYPVVKWRWKVENICTGSCQSHQQHTLTRVLKIHGINRDRFGPPYFHYNKG